MQRIRCFTSKFDAANSLASSFIKPRVGGRIQFAEIVHGIHDAACEEVEPRAIGEGAREVRIVLRRQPINQMRPQRFVLGQVEGLASEESGLHRRAHVLEGRLGDRDLRPFLAEGLSDTLPKPPLILLKKAARAQWSFCDQSRYGSSWHWAHCICTPMKSEATARADPSGVSCRHPRPGRRR